MNVWIQIHQEKDLSVPVVLFVTSKNNANRQNTVTFDCLIGCWGKPIWQITVSFGCFTG